MRQEPLLRFTKDIAEILKTKLRHPIYGAPVRIDCHFEGDAPSLTLEFRPEGYSTPIGIWRRLYFEEMEWLVSGSLSTEQLAERMMSELSRMRLESEAT